MIYRLFTPDDFAALYALEEACFQPPLRFSRAYMRRLVGSQNAATWIAEEEGAMAGFAIVEWGGEADAVTAYIQTIEVAQSKRRLGIGNELMHRMERSARAAGATLIWLHVDAGNAGAIRLYEAQGYRPEGSEANFYPRGRTALVYARALEPPAP